MRACRECGCTEFDACVVDRAGTRYACFWVEADLCSFCLLGVDDEERERPPARGVDMVMPLGGVL